jgi:hypothetical protein
MVEIEIASSQRIPTAAIEAELAERLIFRLSTGVIEAAEARERLRLSVDHAGDQCRFSISRPKALRGKSDSKLFESPVQESGTGSSLRLVRGLARIAGGDLITSPAGFTLAFSRA